ncbi:MAG: hypothetical protein COT73_09715 [Bdellovibrio sp. CG10_big_fil_rev_8_21_14_0_10_47_8]|nr:MAG: hypothetical protein COT73_09715 [Bdellovibrio sp. CG10_big_fil_rev_8_21_14_0_10_47_8]
MPDDQNCFFCREQARSYASERTSSGYVCQNCGNYEIGSQTQVAYARGSEQLGLSHSLNCIAQTLKDNDRGLVPIWVSDKASSVVNRQSTALIYRTLYDFKDVPVRHSEKQNELLKLMARRLSDKHPFDEVTIGRTEAYRLKIADGIELYEWLSLMINAGLILSTQVAAIKKRMTGVQNWDEVFSASIKLTPEGWKKIESFYSNIKSRKAFIAMSFHGDDRASTQMAIEEACREAGNWEAFTIDKKEYVGGITDEIIASINQSRFVIAEFTGGNPGVYFEAGYAEGAGIPVIPLVKKSELDDGKLHFDIRHVNHIGWESADDLKKRLKDRIQAIIRA